MGALISSTREELEEVNDAATQKKKEALEMLQRIIDSQLDMFEAELNAKFLNPEETAKTEVPGIRPLRKLRFSTAQISEKPSEEVDKAIDSFFGTGDDNDPTKKALKNGFKGIVNTALSMFLGNTSVGKKEERKYFIYMHHNAIVRLDVMLWRWNLSNHGFSETYEHVLGYVAYLSVVDIKYLKTSEFVYLLTEYASAAKSQGGNAVDFEKYCAEIQKAYKIARHLMASQRSEIDKEEN